MPDKAKKEKVARPKVSEHERFVGADKSRLSVRLKRFGKQFITYVDHSTMGKGMVTVHSAEHEARVEFDRLCMKAQADGWKKRGTPPVSAFSEMPKAPAVASTEALKFPKTKGNEKKGQRAAAAH